MVRTLSLSPTLSAMPTSAAVIAASFVLSAAVSAPASADDNFGGEIVSHFEGGATRTADVLDDGVTAVVNMGPKLVTYDISNTMAPARLGDVLLPRIPTDVKVLGTHAYVALG